jgi:hypothetical protein
MELLLEVVKAAEVLADAWYKTDRELKAAYDDLCAALDRLEALS